MIVKVSDLAKAHQFFCECIGAYPYEFGGHFSHVVLGETDIILMPSTSGKSRAIIDLPFTDWQNLQQRLEDLSIDFSCYDVPQSSKVASRIVLFIDQDCEVEFVSYKPIDMNTEKIEVV